MKHLKKYNEDSENPITDIMEVDLFSDFHYTVLDVIEEMGSTGENIGFMWIATDIGINNWRYDKPDFYNSIYSKSTEDFSKSVLGSGSVQNTHWIKNNIYSDGNIRMCFCANFKFPVNTKLSKFLSNTKKMQDLEVLLDRLGSSFESIELAQHYSNTRLLRLYAVLSAEETIKIGNKVEMKLPSLT
jgi:hypothetical protein